MIFIHVFVHGNFMVMVVIHSTFTMNISFHGRVENISLQLNSQWESCFIPSEIIMKWWWYFPVFIMKFQQHELKEKEIHQTIEKMKEENVYLKIESWKKSSISVTWDMFFSSSCCCLLFNINESEGLNRKVNMIFKLNHRWFL